MAPRADILNDTSGNFFPPCFVETEADIFNESVGRDSSCRESFQLCLGQRNQANDLCDLTQPVYKDGGRELSLIHI